MLFENMTPQMNHVISKQIQKLITNYEPRARLVQVNNYTRCLIEMLTIVTIFFHVLNQPEQVVVEHF